VSPSPSSLHQAVSGRLFAVDFPVSEPLLG
jgi:hypothetical protein